MVNSTPERWMQYALDLACIARDNGEVPVGAIVVADNKIIGSGWNQVIKRHDPTAHAELLAIQEAANNLNNCRLEDSTLYVTLEPCCMCAGALVHARVKRLVFGTRDFKTGAAGSVYNLLCGYPLNHKVQTDEGILQQQCAKLLTNFFQSKR